MREMPGLRAAQPRTAWPIRAQRRGSVFVPDPGDEREHAVLGEFDQRLDPARLARQVTVQRGSGHANRTGKRGGGYPRAGSAFQFTCQDFQDLLESCFTSARSAFQCPNR
jgi:hypothetical protein